MLIFFILSRDKWLLRSEANALEEDKKMAYAAGMNGHVAKPIDVTVLMDTLFQFIEWEMHEKICIKKKFFVL